MDERALNGIKWIVGGKKGTRGGTERARWRVEQQAVVMMGDVWVRDRRTTTHDQETRVIYWTLQGPCEEPKTIKVLIRSALIERVGGVQRLRGYAPKFKDVSVLI